MNDHDQRRRPPERPRSEPEIIPPERAGRRENSQAQVWVWVADREGVRRTTVTVPGPFTIFLALVLVALVVAAILVAVLGAVLIWLPIFIVAIGALLLAAAIRQYWWRFRRWAAGR